MSCIAILAPALAGIAMPVVAAAAAAVAAQMGFKLVQGKQIADQTAVEDAGHAVSIGLKHGAELAKTMGMDESIVMEKDGVKVTIRRSASGQTEIEARGHKPDSELQVIGEEVSKHLVQACVRARVEVEAKAKGYTLVEEKNADGTIKLRFEKRG